MILVDPLVVMPAAVEKRLHCHFGSDLGWQVIAGEGTAHHIYRSTLGKQVWVARLELQAPSTPGVDRQRESSILKALVQHEWAPTLELEIPEQGFSLMPDYGEPINPNRLHASQVDAIHQTINEMHGISEVPLLDYSGLFNAYRASFTQRAPGLVHVVNLCEAALAGLVDIGRCLVHHDLHGGNLLWNKRLTLIDWEYAGLGSPWFDYASLHRDLGFDLGQLHQFDRLKHLDTDTLTDSLSQALFVIEKLEMIWQAHRRLTDAGESNESNSRINK